MTISMLEWQALSFFGVEPGGDEPPWPYGHYSYVVQRDDLSLSCRICPADHDVRLEITRRGAPLYQFHVLGVQDIIYEQDPVEVRLAHGPGPETLRVIVSGGDEVRLTINPHIAIRHLPRSMSPDRWPMDDA